MTTFLLCITTDLCTSTLHQDAIHTQLSSQLSSAQLSPAQQRRALPFGDVLCGAVPCCAVLSLWYVPGIIRTYQAPGYVY